MHGQTHGWSVAWASAGPTLAELEAVPVGAVLGLPIAFWLAPLGGLLALVFAGVFYAGFMKTSEGDAEMARIAQAVRDGAYAYLARQAKVVYLVIAVLIVVLLVLAFGFGLQERLTPLGVAVAAGLSGLCGFLGMKTATNASARTAHAAKQSLNDGLKVAFRAGAVMGLCVTGFALLDISLWFIVLTQLWGTEQLAAITTVTLSFAMGASLQALFVRVGGGIYTKAADVGADLVGKVEAGIPEDDARNPATIADNVGDNVGDVAGMGADLYESYYGSILAAMALAAAAAMRLGLDAGQSIALVVTPPALAGLGIVCSIAAIFGVRAKENASFAQLLKSLHSGVWLSSVMIVAGSAALLYWLLGDIEAVRWTGVWGAIVIGLIAGLVIAWGTERYTSYEHGPTRRIAEQSETGPATVIIAGIAEGMISSWIPLLTTVVAITIAFTLAGGNETFLMGVFGVGLAAVGMLSTLGITLATDAYGPIADNAGGNAEMTHQPPEVRQRTDMLDSLGNTTAATGKGFAIGSAALTALALLAAYVITVQVSLNRQAENPFDTVYTEVTWNAASPSLWYAGDGLFSINRDGDTVEAGVIVADEDLRGRAEAFLEPLPPEARLVRAEWAPNQAFAIAQLSDDAGPMEIKVVPASLLTLPKLMTFYDVTLMNPKVLCGLFLGVMLVFVFCAMTMNAVGRAAFRMMTECRRQFALMKQGFRADGVSEEDLADPLKWPFQTTVDGKDYPDYANCVAISTGGALREMVAPSLLAVFVPIVVGLILGVPAVMGLLAGTLVCGFAVAIFMANAGGAWDNAKKFIEADHNPELGGKGSDNHKATVVGDTVGDPFKDTSGPSLNILIKLVSVVSVVFAAVVVKYSPAIGAALGLG
ncbi:MAG: sodium-translocating pyrophosphatase [Planctomycetota bacterium]